MKTTWIKENAPKQWFEVDATDKVLGRLASEIAMILMGKRKAIYTPFIDSGDFVVVTNAHKVKVTGNKLKDKKYYWHSGYFGGLKERTLEKMLQEKPEEVIYLAVKKMLPKNRLGRKMIKKLKVYTTPDHPHTAQKPVKLEF
ncbi:MULTISPECIES: 50S ribosomal protein L13 [Calditerrivibrio]|jgi:large subunit ribosomal protein L13|uniref:Large ribosomal subunit protein uL13 n=1 Tax=Calditerrivibrio nitroreducens (strain DSM 19672 / NBRC 101217 / Yu37-1) TaxID=768670 RepID=E4THH3_CALNY|nr:50S ribosomal protein L13 [Calditerrivibrio nitroreducens]ADR19908.1 LSU ribosomal protein L13P [Calditerrivibrio nitroreducens DSM 19672]